MPVSDIDGRAYLNEKEAAAILGSLSALFRTTGLTAAARPSRG